MVKRLGQLKVWKNPVAEIEKEAFLHHKFAFLKSGAHKKNIFSCHEIKIEWTDGGTDTEE